MKARSMLTCTLLVAAASVAIASIRTWPPASPDSKLAFRTEDGHLMASLPLRVNNSPALIDTSFVVDEEQKSVSLAFVVVQNRDLYRRSIRQVTPTWDLGTISQKDYSFQIKGSVVALETEQLKTLLPKADG
jgi:hypothetical protein